ncbi:MAG TPA: hypothetical protein VFV27_02715 [Nevskiaceae bacterium]|nr:hypothetical protein [Nevskiaceae bacterium]
MHTSAPSVPPSWAVRRELATLLAVLALPLLLIALPGWALLRPARGRLPVPAVLSRRFGLRTDAA